MGAGVIEPERALHLQPALDRIGGLYTMAHVVDAIESGQARLWTGDRSTIVTEIVDHPTGREIVFWLAGGDLDEIVEMTAHIEAWAAARGCVQAKIIGRDGWVRMLPGYRKHAVILTKGLSHG